MSYISKIDPETAGEKEKEVIRDHLAQGYRLTNEKLTLLHNAEAFKAIEDSSYTLDRELQRLIGKRAGDFFEYAISEENDCLVCSTYFRKLLKDNGIDFDTFQFTKKEELKRLGIAVNRAEKYIKLDGEYQPSLDIFE